MFKSLHRRALSSRVPLKASSSGAPVQPNPSHAFCGRRRISSLLETEDEGVSQLGQTVEVCGWARTIRQAGGGSFCFVELNDGSCLRNLQVVVDASVGEEAFGQLKKLGTGASFRFVGELVESQGGGQKVELQVKGEAGKVTVFGDGGGSAFPLAKKRHSKEYLRQIAHLRPRTNLIGAVSRVRNSMAAATHAFFQERGFLYVHTPIITAADCEGAGEMFHVTTILSKLKYGEKDAAKQPLPPKALDASKDFFGKPAFLTVSGQLAVENFCCALSDVYTFGPTFRAENSNTARHLAEFWMVEPELAFADLETCVRCGEAYLKFCVEWALKNCKSDIAFFEKWVDKSLSERLRDITEKPFSRVSYTEAVDMLQKAVKEGTMEFENTPEWGDDLQTEHERWLAETVFKGPVVVVDYPRDLKAFYMKQNEDGKTVAAMDVLVPRIGEVIGGSQREENLEKLEKRMKECDLDLEAYWWYRDLRRFGTVPHAGFGLGFERLLMLVTGLENIREVIPYPRWPSHADF